MLFQAASPRPRTQFSSLSGEPRAPCFVSAHSPVPTLRICTRKRERVTSESPRDVYWGPCRGGGGNQGGDTDGLSSELPNTACPGRWQHLVPSIKEYSAIGRGSSKPCLSWSTQSLRVWWGLWVRGCYKEDSLAPFPENLIQEAQEFNFILILGDLGTTP